MQHNNETFKLLAMYIGCQCDVTANGYHFPKSQELTPELLHQAFYGTREYDIKPILKPLSKITDKDCKKLADVCFATKKDWIVKHNKYAISVHSISGQTLLIWHMDSSLTIDGDKSDVLHLYDLLRSWGYALPYMGKDLFTAGIAIEEQAKSLSTF
jgi:hypothetical protein